MRFDFEDAEESFFLFIFITDRSLRRFAAPMCGKFFRKKTGTRCGTLRKEGATVIFALQRVILLCSYMMLRIVILSFGQLRGEYNITETARFQYHFCC